MANMLNCWKRHFRWSKIAYIRLFCTQQKTTSTTPIPTPQQIADLLLGQKSASEALQTFRWASKLPAFTHTQSTYRALIHKLCTFRKFDIAKQMLDGMPGAIGSPPDDDIFITFVRGLGRAKRILQVIKVVDLVAEFGKTPTLKLFNTILDVLVEEDIDIAREFYRKKMMGASIEGDDYTHAILMKGLCLTNRIGDGFKLLQLMKTRGLKPNTIAYNTLINALCRNGKVGRARNLMNQMEEPNDVTFNILISAYCREENLVQALVMLEKSFSCGFIPDIVTLTKLVDIICIKGNISMAFEVLQRVEQMGRDIDVVAYNTLIKGYCRIGKVKFGYRLLKEMEMKGRLPNADTYNVLISGFCEHGMLDVAIDMFNEMRRAGISSNFVSYDTLIRGLCSRGRTTDGLKILELMEESEKGCEGRINPYNSIIYGLYRENNLGSALEFLENMRKLFPRTVDRSLRILCLCNEGNLEEGKLDYNQMTSQGDFPSYLVYANLIVGFCEKGCWKEALELMNDMIGDGYLPVAATFNVVISGFCRQGKVGTASKFLEDMIARGCNPDSGSYYPLISAFSGKGDFHKALMFFLQMVEKGIAPDYCSWNALVQCLCYEKIRADGRNKFRVDNQLRLIIET